MAVPATRSFGWARLRIVELLALAGQAVYDQYGTPFAGQTYGAFDGYQRGDVSRRAVADAPVAHACARARHVRRRRNSRFCARTSAFDGARPAYADRSSGRQTDRAVLRRPFVPQRRRSRTHGRQSALSHGFGFDVQERRERTAAGRLRQRGAHADARCSIRSCRRSVERHHVAARCLNSVSRRTSRTRGASSPRVTLHDDPACQRDAFLDSATAIATASASIDPHADAERARGSPGLALLATYDHTSVAPLPLEAQRLFSSQTPNTVRGARAGGRRHVRALVATRRPGARAPDVFREERYRISSTCCLRTFAARRAPANNPRRRWACRRMPAICSCTAIELVVSTAVRFALTGTYTHGFSSSASQFGYNDLNAPAIAAGLSLPARIRARSLSRR